MFGGFFKAQYRSDYHSVFQSIFPGEGGGPPPGTLAISPDAPTVATLATQLFTASGGTGPYTFAISTNNSGASLVDHGDVTATYTAGPVLVGVTDVVTVTDSVAATADATVHVTVSTPTGLRAWYDANEGVTVSAGNVVAWADQSGNGYDLTPPGGLDEPTLHAGIINGLPGVLFDTPNGNAQLNNTFVGGIANNAPYYVVAVLKPTVPTVGPQPAGFSWGGPVAVINVAGGLLFYPVLGDFAGSLYVTGNDNFTPDPTTANTPYLYEWGSTGVPGSLLTYLDGSAIGPGGFISASDTGAQLTVGSDNGIGNGSFCGYICEMLIYDHVLTGGELTTLRAYVDGKYGL